jgi:hypothetical protein
MDLDPNIYSDQADVEKEKEPVEDKKDSKDGRGQDQEDYQWQTLL